MARPPEGEPIPITPTAEQPDFDAAFRQWQEDESAMALIRRLTEQGKAVDAAKPETREAFESAIDALDGKPEAEFLFTQHPVYGASVLGVIRSLVGPAIDGKPLERKIQPRGVGDKSGKRHI